VKRIERDLLLCSTRQSDFFFNNGIPCIWGACQIKPLPSFSSCSVPICRQTYQYRQKAGVGPSRFLPAFSTGLGKKGAPTSPKASQRGYRKGEVVSSSQTTFSHRTGFEAVITQSHTLLELDSELVNFSPDLSFLRPRNNKSVPLRKPFIHESG
jgi:hypothetical protein